MDEKNKDIIENLEEENKLLRQKLEEYSAQSDKCYSTLEWAKILSQEEIDSVVTSRIAKDMFLYYNMSELSSVKVIEEVIDFCYKNIDSIAMPEALKNSLSLGLQTTHVLDKSIYIFLSFVMNANEKEMGFVFDNGYDEYYGQ